MSHLARKLVMLRSLFVGLFDIVPKDSIDGVENHNSLIGS
jgi:hypothetical protein